MTKCEDMLMVKQEQKKTKRATIIGVLLFAIVLVAIVVGISIKDTVEHQELLEDSIKSQLISISVAARGMVNVDAMDSYNSIEDVHADMENYVALRAQLRDLAADVGADYIYALKMIDGECMFVLDSDPEDEEIFIPYEMAQVHKDAFNGQESADVMNVVDIYGSFNTGAVPVMKDGRVIAVISTDIEDKLVQESLASSRRNAVFLGVSLAVVLALMGGMTVLLQRKVDDMHGALEQMAHYDAVTGLPNRQYLLEYLKGISKAGEDGKELPYALFFIDLDNFKSINDNAGHDAGDELLARIGRFLEASPEDAKAFRPSAGTLNIAARIGGDEFVQVVHGVENTEQASQVAQHLLDSFADGRFAKYIKKYNLGMSIGIALYPAHTNNYHVLIKYADVAMYYAKHGGKNAYRVYEEEMGADEEPG